MQHQIGQGNNQNKQINLTQNNTVVQQQNNSQLKGPQKNTQEKKKRPNKLKQNSIIRKKISAKQENEGSGQKPCFIIQFWILCCFPCHDRLKRKTKCYKNLGERLENFDPNKNDQDRLLNESLYLCWGLGIIYTLFAGIIAIIFSTRYISLTNDYDTLIQSDEISAIKNVYDDYTTDLISEIIFLEQGLQCPEDQGYTETEVINYKFDGISQGCYCPLEQVFYNQQCCTSGVTEYCGECEQADSGINFIGEPSKIIPGFAQYRYGQPNEPAQTSQFTDTTFLDNRYFKLKGCKKQEVGYSIQKKAAKVSDSGELSCESENDKLCGGFICFPKDQKCPVTSIKLSNEIPQDKFSKYDYGNDIYDLQIFDINSKPINLRQKILIQHMTDDDQNKSPVIGFFSSQGEGVCLNSRKLNYENAEYFGLQDRKPCQTIDKQYIKTGLEQIEEIFYLLLDKSIYDLLQTYITDSVPEYKRNYLQGNINWYYRIYDIEQINALSSQKCQEIVQNYENFDKKQEDIKDEKFWPVVIFYSSLVYYYAGLSIFLGLPIVSITFYFSQIKGSKTFKKLRILIFVLSLLFYPAVMYGFYTIKQNYYDEIQVSINDFYEDAQKSKCPKFEEIKVLQEKYKEIKDTMENSMDTWVMFILYISPFPIYITITIMHFFYVTYQQIINQSKDDNNKKKVHPAPSQTQEQSPKLSNNQQYLTPIKDNCDKSKSIYPQQTEASLSKDVSKNNLLNTDNNITNAFTDMNDLNMQNNQIQNQQNQQQQYKPQFNIVPLSKQNNNQQIYNGNIQNLNNNVYQNQQNQQQKINNVNNQKNIQLQQPQFNLQYKPQQQPQQQQNYQKQNNAQIKKNY